MKKKKHSSVLEEAREAMQKALTEHHEEMANAPKKFKFGEGVQDVHPDDADKHLK